MVSQRSINGRPTSPRLASFNYIGPYRYSLTICTDKRVRAFVGDWPYLEALWALSAAAGKYGFDVWAFCFMPDHCHLLAEGNEKARLIPFIRRFKQQVGYHYKMHAGASLWQRSFHDRILRTEEDTRNVIRYILNNPVRKGLVTEALDYLFIGSFVAPLEDWL